MPKATPEAPAGLTAAGSNALVRLAWSAAAGATGYRVKRASVNGGPYDPVGAAAATNYNDAAVVNDVTYYYVVAATNSAGESTNSAQAVATPSADPLLLALRQLKDHVNGVTNLNAVQIDAHKLTIDAHKARFAESTNIIAAVFDLVRAYDTKVGPLWVVHPSFSRSTQANDLDWTVYWVMQYTMDYIYKAATLAQCEALLTGFKFGSSSNFPGPCAAPPTNQTCAAAVNASFPDTFGRDTQGWTTPARRPTGAYLAPGTIVTVTVPAALVGKGYQVRVGAHSWDFSNKPTVARLDRSSLLYDITNTDTKVASPLGGGIYIEVPMLATGGVVSVTTIGAARSPFFQATSFHQTTSNEWVATERTQPGPWADYQTDKFMMQVPRSWMYNTAYPSAVMTNWDLAMDAINDLMGFPHVRGKDTMYYQVDLLMRASVYAPGYPTVNLSYNPVTDYGGNVNNYLLTGPQSVPDYVFHEQGHSYFFPKFPGETESAVNLLHVPVQNRQFGASLDDAFRGSVNYGNFHNVTNAPLDNAAVLWMTSFDFSPREVAMADWEKAYQPQGHAKFVDVARLFGWDGLNAFWYYYNSNDTYSISYPTDSDSMLLQLCKSVGRDVRPLFHFWGILPLNPTNLAAQVAAANLSAPNEIRDLLYSCKSLVPANNAAYRSWCLMWYGAPPNYNTGYGVEREHARQWDTNVLVDVSQQERFPTEIFDETASAEVKARVQEIIDLYYPPGLVWDANGTAAGRTDGAGTWTNAGRWWTGTTNQIWPAGTNAVIGVGGTGGTIALGGAVTVFHLTFSPFSGTYALATSGSLTLYGGLTLNSGAGVVIISRPVTLGAAQTWLNNSTNLLTVSGAVTNGANLLTVDGTGPTVISGAIGGGAGGLVKAGRGELTLAGSNTYSGATMVSAGTLTVAAGGRLGSGDLTVAEGATLAVQGAGAIGDSASVYLNGMLDLAAGVTETVGRLYIDGVPQPPGAWNATSDPAHFSGSGSLLVTGMDPPAAPTGLAAAGSNALVRLTWNAAANATGYRVKRALVSGGPYAPVAATAAANCDDATVTNFVTYYYVVSATNAGGESADSGEAVATPSDTPPAASFAAAALSVAEGAGTVWLTVNLSKAFICTVSLRPVVTGGTAGGADYAYAPVLLAFDPGVTSRTFGVSIVNDGEGEPAETLVFGLDSLTNATAGAPATCTVTIEEDAADWTLPFVETFEARTEGALAGQNGWQGADAVVQTNVTWSGSAKAGGMSAPAGAAWHPFGDGRTRVWTDLYVQPTFVAQPTNPPTGSSAVFYVDTNGQVVAFDGATPTPLTHAPLGQGQWVRFTVYTDYADRRWSLYLNDSPTPVAQGLRFCSDTNSGYRALAIYGSAPFDNVSITLVPPEGLPPPGRMLIFVR
jgi:autotransporter-associated beta strand protein